METHHCEDAGDVDQTREVESRDRKRRERDRGGKPDSLALVDGRRPAKRLWAFTTHELLETLKVVDAQVAELDLNASQVILDLDCSAAGRTMCGNAFATESVTATARTEVVSFIEAGRRECGGGIESYLK